MSGEDKDEPGLKDWEVREDKNRQAARIPLKKLKKTKAEMEKELEEGLRDSFPASDPLTATRPAAKQEDSREGTPRPGKKR